jgi:ABC-2 type transport system permease protein
MNMKSLKIAFKGIRVISRDRRGFAFLLVFPVLFIAVFSFAFGSGAFEAGGSLPHDITVVNYDAGTSVVSNNVTQRVNYGYSFTQVLENATAESGSTKLFRLNNVSEEKANELLRSRSIDALIIIPENFSRAFASMVNDSASSAIKSEVGAQTLAGGAAGLTNPTGNALAENVTLPKASNVTSALSVEGDSGYINFQAAQGLIVDIFNHFKNDVTAEAVANATSGGGDYGAPADYTPVKMNPIPGTQSFTPFDYMVPGLIIVAILMQVTQVSGSLVRDIERGTLDRLKLSTVGTFDLLFGTFLTWTLVTIVQVPLLIAVATGLGYKYSGSFSSLELAIVIGVIAGMASISLALLVASFAKSEMQALELGAIIVLPVAFLAGAFFPLPKHVLGEFAGRTYVVYDVLPWTHAISALRSVLTYGTGLSPDIVFDITWLIALTAILFVAGVVCYSRLRLRPET